MNAEISKTNRNIDIGETSGELKTSAKNFKIPIIALSQLSRGVDSRMDKRPILSDLRDSGSIEQDSDEVLLMYRDIVYNPETEKPYEIELNVAKNRHGESGIALLEHKPVIWEITESIKEPNKTGISIPPNRSTTNQLKKSEEKKENEAYLQTMLGHKVELKT